MRFTLSPNIPLLAAHIHHVASYSLPQHAAFPLARALAIDVTRNGFTYGPSVGGGPFYPAGLLGLAKDAVDVAAEGIESAAELALTTADEVAAATAGNGKVRTDSFSVLPLELRLMMNTSTMDSPQLMTIPYFMTENGPTHCLRVLSQVFSPTIRRISSSAWNGSPMRRFL